MSAGHDVRVIISGVRADPRVCSYRGYPNWREIERAGRTMMFRGKGGTKESMVEVELVRMLRSSDELELELERTLVRCEEGRRGLSLAS